jgi:REP element-mobilizing transposase RayT
MTRHFHRRNLPHLYYSEGVYFITYRLANSIPIKAFKTIRSALVDISKNKVQPLVSAAELNLLNEREKRLFKKYDSILDSGEYGEKYLVIPQIVKTVKHTIHFSDGKDYKLISYCIMPNHVHLVFELLKFNKGISKIMQSIKRISGTDSNLFLNRKGKFWQDESFDRLVRDDMELYNIIKYVLLNPVNAGLVKNWNDWKNTFCNEDYLLL